MKQLLSLLLLSVIGCGDDSVITARRDATVDSADAADSADVSDSSVPTDSAFDASETFDSHD